MGAFRPRAVTLLLALSSAIPQFSAERHTSPLIVDCAKEQWPQLPGCKYRCPDNSCVKARAKCVDSFADCECEQWYKK